MQNKEQDNIHHFGSAEIQVNNQNERHVSYWGPSAPAALSGSGGTESRGEEEKKHPFCVRFFTSIKRRHKEPWRTLFLLNALKQQSLLSTPGRFIPAGADASNCHPAQRDQLEISRRARGRQTPRPAKTVKTAGEERNSPVLLL